MVVTARTPLGAATTNRKWWVDIDTSGTTGTTPTYVGLHGITEFTPVLEGSMQDDSDFDGGGWMSEVNTANRWRLEATVIRKTKADDPKAYDAGQEYLRARAAETGVKNVVRVRWYEMEPGGPRVEAYEGFAAVSWSPSGGGVDATSTAAIVLSGRGARKSIAHPDAAGAA